MERVDTLVVDKTGTLTEGKPKLVAIVPAGGFEEAEVLRLAEFGPFPIELVERPWKGEDTTLREAEPGHLRNRFEKQFAGAQRQQLRPFTAR